MKWLILLFPAILWANTETLRKTGDVLQIANPVIALLLTTRNGTQDDFMLQYVQSILIVGSGKMLGKSTHFQGSQRPDKTSYAGMPSGHTASAWLPAANTRNPFLYGTAIITGASRITSKRHYWYQVLASVVVCETVVFLNRKYIVAHVNAEEFYVGVRLIL